MQKEAADITCEIAWATSERQYLESVTVPYGSTVLSVLEASGFCGRVDELAAIPLHALQLGIFGEHVRAPAEQTVRQGERIEIYRPLQIDPKQARRARARRKD
ncbi:RnfH family protein [Kushneria pakistanensis]|uniref:RnfH family protein n=1 Tax=Kushneria pakistanensis TaxID=1508770 RepID=UPI0016746BC3